MNASEANTLTKQNSDIKRDMKKAFKTIKSAAANGQFSAKLSVGNPGEAMTALRDLGYGASQSEVDSENNIIFVSWASV